VVAQDTATFTSLNQVASRAIRMRDADPYPTLLRMGHVFEAVVGQRLVVDGFYGALDVAIGGDDWYYVLNKWVSGSLQYPRVRYAVCNLKDEFPRNIQPAIDGQPEKVDEERFPSPVCCDSDQKGTLFFTDEHANKVVVMNTAGETLGWWGEAGGRAGEFNAPSGIHYAPDRTLWIASSRNGRLQNFTPEGKYLRGFGEFGTQPGQLNYPWGVGVDPVNGSVLVADWRNDCVKRFSPDGELLQVFRELGRGLPPLKRPSDVAVDAHGDVYVCDRGNDRIVQFNPRGLFIESFHGDAPMTERGADKLMANPDMCRWRDHIVDLDREKRFWKPSAVKVDDQFRLFVIDAGRYRMQVYRKRFRVLQPGQVEPSDAYTAPKLN
jgi:sugar lactone lactonase YvrE